MDDKLAKQISAQKKKLKDEKQKLVDLQAKVEEVEIKRFQRLAKKVGLFDIEISDLQFENSLKQLVEAARSPQNPESETA